MRNAVVVLLAFQLASCSSTVEKALPRAFNSVGRNIPIEVALPTQTPAPAVVIVPGRSGLPFYRSRIHHLRDLLVTRGYVVVIPAFLGRNSVDVPAEVDVATFNLWRQTVGDSVEFAARLPQSRYQKVAVVGFSLGAFAAAARAADDTRISVLVSNSAGLSSFFPAEPARMPPTLIIHARRDPVVPVAQAEALAAVVRRFSWAKTVLFESDEHVLSGEQWLQSAGEVVRFLEQAMPARRGNAQAVAPVSSNK